MSSFHQPYPRIGLISHYPYRQHHSGVVHPLQYHNHSSINYIRYHIPNRGLSSRTNADVLQCDTGLYSTLLVWRYNAEEKRLDRSLWYLLLSLRANPWIDEQETEQFPTFLIYYNLLLTEPITMYSNKCTKILQFTCQIEILQGK